MNLSSRRLLLLILATFAIVAAACGSESAVDQAPVSIPDPGAATAVAAVSTGADFVPIRADMDNEPAEFLDAIPETDRSCLEEIWGVDRSRLSVQARSDSTTRASIFSSACPERRGRAS